MSDPISIDVASALLGDAFAPSGPVRLTLADGAIRAITPLPRGDVAPSGRRLLAMPSLADAHNHARPLSTTSFGCGAQPLELWLPHLAIMPSVDPYLAALASLGRSLRGGATGVMVHLTRAMGQKPLPEEAREIARAAADLGVSIGFAISMRDRNPLILGDHAEVLEGLAPEVRAQVRATWLAPSPPIEAQLEIVDAVAEAVHDLPGHIDVQYGPTGVQWCSDRLLSAIAVASASNGRRVHMHFLETQPQRRWAERSYPAGLAAHLEDIGLLTPRLTLAHAVWADADDLRRIATAGARIAVNVSSNLHLFSGIAAVARMLAAGVDVAMGLDGCALDEDDDALRELRLFHLLNRVPGFGAGGLSPTLALRAACVTGRAGLGLPEGGVLAQGMPADLLLLDLDALDRDELLPVDPRDLLFARAHRAHIVDIYARGRRVMREGQVLGADLDAAEEELRRAYRAALPQTTQLRSAWPAIGAAIADHYKGCC